MCSPSKTMALLYDFTDSGSFTAAGLGPFLVDGGTRIAEETFGDKGYSGYRVSPTVQRHEAQGAGRPFWWGQGLHSARGGKTPGVDWETGEELASQNAVKFWRGW